MKSILFLGFILISIFSISQDNKIHEYYISGDYYLPYSQTSATNPVYKLFYETYKKKGSMVTFDSIYPVKPGSLPLKEYDAYLKKPSDFLKTESPAIYKNTKKLSFKEFASKFPETWKDSIHSVRFFEKWTFDPKTGVFEKTVYSTGFIANKNYCTFNIINVLNDKYTGTWYETVSKNEFNYSLNNVLLDCIEQDISFSSEPGDRADEKDIQYVIPDYYQNLEWPERTDLVISIMEFIRNNPQNVFNTDGKPLTLKEIAEILSSRDQILTLDETGEYQMDENGNYLYQDLMYSYDVSQVKGLRFYETWYYNPGTFSIKKVVNGISLNISRNDINPDYYPEYNPEYYGETDAGPSVYLYIRLNDYIKDNSGQMLRNSMCGYKEWTKLNYALNKVTKDSLIYLYDNKGNKVLDESLKSAVKDFNTNNIQITKTRNLSEAPDSLYVNYSYEGYYELITTYDVNGILSPEGKVLVPCNYTIIQPYNNSISIVKKNLKTGAIDSNGKIIIPVKFSDIFFDESNTIKVIDGYVDNWGYSHGNSGLYDYSGKEILPCLYTNISELYQGSRVISTDSHHGLIDAQGKVISDTIYEELVFQNNGLIKGKKDGKYGFIDNKGKIIIPFNYLFAHDFDNDTCKVYIQGDYHYIDKTGKRLGKCGYDNETKINGDILIATVGIYWHIDLQGVVDGNRNELVPCIYDNLSWVGENRLIAQKGKTYGVIDYFGKVIVPFEYSGIYNFDTDKISLVKDKKTGVCDLNGNIIIPVDFSTVQPFATGIYVAGTETNESYTDPTGKFYFYDGNGKLINGVVYEYIDYTLSGLAMFKKAGKYGFINDKLQEINYGKYDWTPISYYADRTGNGFRLVYKGEIDEQFQKGKFGLVDSTGKEIVPCKYNAIMTFDDSGFARVFIGTVSNENVPLKGKYGLINKKGVQIVPNKYDLIYGEHRGLYIVYNGTLNEWGGTDKGKYGLMDATGKLIFPLIYDEIDYDYYNNYNYYLIKGDERIDLDENNKIVKPE